MRERTDGLSVVDPLGDESVVVISRLDGRFDAVRTAVARRARPAAPARATALRGPLVGFREVKAVEERFVAIIASRYRRVSEEWVLNVEAASFCYRAGNHCSNHDQFGFTSVLSGKCWNSLRTTFLSGQSRQDRLSILLLIQLLCIDGMARNPISI